MNKFPLPETGLRRGKGSPDQGISRYISIGSHNEGVSKLKNYYASSFKYLQFNDTNKNEGQRRGHHG